MPPETPADRHRSHLPVLIGAILIVAALALFLAINSPASALT